MDNVRLAVKYVKLESTNIILKQIPRNIRNSKSGNMACSRETGLKHASTKWNSYFEIILNIKFTPLFD